MCLNSLGHLSFLLSIINIAAWSLLMSLTSVLVRFLANTHKNEILCNTASEACHYNNERHRVQFIYIHISMAFFSCIFGKRFRSFSNFHLSPVLHLFSFFRKLLSLIFLHVHKVNFYHWILRAANHNHYI